MTRKKPSQIMFADEETQEEIKASVKQEESEVSTKTDSVVHHGSPVLDLPSQGKLGYDSSITHRDILVKDEEVLATATPTNFARTMNNVLRGICNNPSFFDSMSVHDRDFLLVWLWSNNYTPVKEVEVVCSSRECGAKHTYQVDMTELDVKPLKDDYKPLKIPLSLGEEGAYIRVRPNTVKDENEVEAFLEKMSNKTDAKKLPSFEHLMLVSSIDVGMNIPLDKKMEWVGENVTGKEMGFVKKFHEFFKFGVQDTIDYTCKSCQEVTTGELPFQVFDILRPSVSSSDDEFLSLMQGS